MDNLAYFIFNTHGDKYKNVSKSCVYFKWQEEPMDESSHGDYRQFLNALQSNWPRNYRGYEDASDFGSVNPLDRFHMQRMLRSAMPAFPSSHQHISGYQTANVMETPAASSPGVQRFYAMYRLPEMKRQARYRQCYFNPVSCFK